MLNDKGLEKMNFFIVCIFDVNVDKVKISFLDMCIIFSGIVFDILMLLIVV